MNLCQTGTVAEYKASHAVLAAQINLPMMQRLIYWEQGLKPEIRAECKLDPVSHTSHMDLAKSQSAAIAIDSHLSVAAVKTESCLWPPCGPLAAAVSAGPSSSKLKHSHIVHWTLEDGDFSCPLSGAMAEPHTSLPPSRKGCSDSRSGGKLMPREFMKPKTHAGVCFVNGNTEPHVWGQY